MNGAMRRRTRQLLLLLRSWELEVEFEFEPEDESTGVKADPCSTFKLNPDDDDDDPGFSRPIISIWKRHQSYKNEWIEPSTINKSLFIFIWTWISSKNIEIKSLSLRENRTTNETWRGSTGHKIFQKIISVTLRVWNKKRGRIVVEIRELQPATQNWKWVSAQRDAQFSTPVDLLFSKRIRKRKKTLNLGLQFLGRRHYKNGQELIVFWSAIEMSRGENGQ